MDMTLREVCTATNVSRRAVQGYEKAGLVHSCVELKKYYSFNMEPRIANSSVYLVDKKTGKYRIAYFMEVVNEPILQRYDKKDFV